MAQNPENPLRGINFTNRLGGNETLTAGRKEKTLFRGKPILPFVPAGTDYWYYSLNPDSETGFDRNIKPDQISRSQFLTNTYLSQDGLTDIRNANRSANLLMTQTSGDTLWLSYFFTNTRSRDIMTGSLSGRPSNNVFMLGLPKTQEIKFRQDIWDDPTKVDREIWNSELGRKLAQADAVPRIVQKDNLLVMEMPPVDVWEAYCNSADARDPIDLVTNHLFGDGVRFLNNVYFRDLPEVGRASSLYLPIRPLTQNFLGSDLIDNIRFVRTEDPYNDVRPDKPWIQFMRIPYSTTA